MSMHWQSSDIFIPFTSFYIMATFQSQKQRFNRVEVAAVPSAILPINQQDQFHAAIANVPT